MMLKSKMYQMMVLACWILLYLSTGMVYSAETKLTTSLGLRQEYNDNVLYTRSDEIDDYVSYAIPSFRLQHATELLELSALASWSGWLFWDESDLNRVNQRYGLNGSYRFTERWSVSGLARYVKDSLQDSQLDETGSVDPGLDDRERINAGAGLDYAVSERSEIGSDYNFQKTNFEGRRRIDIESHSVRFFYRRRLQNERDVITIFPRFVWGDTETYDAYSTTLNFRWDHPFSETLNTSITIGVRNTHIDFKDDRDNTTDWGGVADMSLRKTGELTTGLIGFTNRLRPRTNGELINVSRLFTDIDHRLSRRFGVGIRGSVWFSQLIEDDPDDDDDRWFYRISPSAFYRLTENHIIRLLYSYDWEKALDAEGDRTRDRQRVWLQLTFNFPKTW